MLAIKSYLKIVQIDVALKSIQQSKSKNIPIETAKSTSDDINLFISKTPDESTTMGQEIRNADEQICWNYNTRLARYNNAKIKVCLWSL